MSIEIIQIDHADVIFDDRGSGAGKITISDTVNGMNFSYYWGSMGSPLKEFVASIDQYYFTKNLIGHGTHYVMDPKKTFTSVRKRLKEEMSWYQHMEFQKDLREQLKTLERDCHSEDHFIHQMCGLPDRLDYYSLDNMDRSYVKKQLSEIFSEPWHFIEKSDSGQAKYLYNLHQKLKKELKKNLTKTL